MVTFESTKRLLATDFRIIDDLIFLQNSRVKLYDAYNMLNKHEEYGLTKEAIDREFFKLFSEPGYEPSLSPKDIFMSNNINCAIELINIREKELLNLPIDKEIDNIDLEKE